MKLRQSVRCAFTLFELFIVAVFLFVAFLMVPIGHGGGSVKKAQRVKCVNNLKNIGLAYRLYAEENGGHFPWQTTNGSTKQTYILSDLLRYSMQISNQLRTPKILSCPADNRPVVVDWNRLKSAQQLSYFVSTDAVEPSPKQIIAGDRNLTNGTKSLSIGVRTIPHDTQLSWDGTIHRNQGNISMADGSVYQMSFALLRDSVRNALQDTNKSLTWIVP